MNLLISIYLIIHAYKIVYFYFFLIYLFTAVYRKQLLSTWEKAAKFIEDNESRIRLETRVIEGEEFQVWRWLPVSFFFFPPFTYLR